MFDDGGLLKTIAVNPADDAVRFAFADWCEGHGNQLRCPKCDGSGAMAVRDPEGDTATCNQCDGSGWWPDALAARAEFIRLQYDLEHKPEWRLVPILEEFHTDVYGPGEVERIIRGYKDPPERAAAVRRCDKLFVSYRRDWWPDFDRPDVRFHLSSPMPVAHSAYHFGVRNGFPEVLWCPGAMFLAPGFARWFADSFPLREIRLTDIPPRRTAHRTGGMTHRYAFWRPQPIELRSTPAGSTLPDRITPSDGRARWNFKTERDAYRWLSDLCLEYARTAPPPTDDDLVYLPTRDRT